MAAEQTAHRKRKRKILLLYFTVGFGILLLAFFICWIFFLRFIEYTDDAYVQGNQVAITPLHPGFVTAIHTDDTFLVTKGQLLVELDKTDSKIALDLAKDRLAQTVRDVCELFHQVFVYSAEIDMKTAELIRDAQDYLHRLGVFRQKGVSLENYEHAIAQLRAQFSSLQLSGALYNKALSAVQMTTIYNHPKVVAASEAVRDAWVNLYRCDLYSPVEGLVAQRTIQVGMWAPAGQPLLTVIPLDQIWVNANYKETQVKRMRIGQKIKITADLWGDSLEFHGTIVGLPGGAGNAFSLLPPQNLSGNWIKIVQRLPVRVALDPKEIKEHPLRIGLTCKATVDTRGQGGKQVPDSSFGSPLYQTSIFEREEKGDREWIDRIVAMNLDPSLSEYAQSPLQLAVRTISLPLLVQEALREEEFLQKQIEKGPKGMESFDETSLRQEFKSPFYDFLYGEYLR
jgi:membrane fusion protein (multidrug efflux system)